MLIRYLQLCWLMLVFLCGAVRRFGRAAAPHSQCAAGKNLLARATVTGAGGAPQVYEAYRPHAAVMGTEKLYQISRPPRVRPLNRPPVITPTPHEGFRILHLRGAFHNYYRIPEAAQSIGGHWAFGGGGYAGTALEKLLPATTAGPFDVVQVKNGYLKPAPDKDLKVGTLWMQKLTVRPGAQAPITAGGQPFWIHWARGKGRVIVLAGLCYGEAPKEMTLFTEWPGWPTWLAARLQQAVAETRR